MKYRRKIKIVEAVQWLKAGDHPKVVHNRYDLYLDDGFRYPDVHPGDYILTYSDGTIEVKTQEDIDRDWENVENICKNCNGCGKVHSRFNKGTWLEERKCATCHGTGKVED